MRQGKFTRRDVLKGSAAAAFTVYASPLRAAAPPAEAITPALIEAAKKEGKLVFYTAMDLAFAQRLANTFEEKFPGISVRVERSGAERIFTRIDQEYSSNIHAVDVVNTADPGPLHRLEAQPVARAVHARGCREAFRQGLLRSRRTACDDANSGLTDRLQYQPGEEGGGAEELRRPARSEMGRQDRQGAPGLQRHHHECDVPDRARPRLGLLREARQAARHAGAVGDRHAQEDFAGRARGHGRRRGLPGHPLPRGGPAGRHRLPGRRGRRLPPARARCSRPPPIPTPLACSRTGCTRARASS